MLVKISDHLCLPLKNLNQPVWFYASNHFTYDSKITWFVEGFVYQVKLGSLYKFCNVTVCIVQHDGAGQIISHDIGRKLLLVEL